MKNLDISSRRAFLSRRLSKIQESLARYPLNTVERFHFRIELLEAIQLLQEFYDHENPRTE